MKNVWRSGIIFTAISFLTSIVFYLFQMVVSRQFHDAPGEFGLMNNTITFMGFLGLPLAIATQAVTHYIARFHFSGDDARLHGLLAGCREFLFHITIIGSIIAVIAVKPLGDFFHISRTSLTIIALVCVLGGLWASYVTALCQGLGWFKRLALIGLLGAMARVLFGWPTTHIQPIAEWGVLASVAMLLPNLILLFWRKEFPRRTKPVTSPWTSEFVQFLIVSAAYVIGWTLFNQGDNLVAQRYFSDADRDAYSVAEKLAVALPTAVGPLLIVLFTHRSSHHHKDARVEQLKLAGLYAVGLISGAIGLYLLRNFCVGLLNPHTPEASALIGRLSVTMVFVGLLQLLGIWSLASRWLKISLLYGALGLGYWLTILSLGKSPAALIQTMPVAAGTAFVIFLVIWLVTLRRHKPAVQS
ncbi:MAG TPA: hypothetical protein VMJ12_17980 [Candidatus Acidoferrales bacterium]|nr:hypothetical protein [Candidatus Acidoferrales bacterium]